MIAIQLYIGDHEVEMFKDESITLSQSIQDVKDIAKIFTEFSKTFNVPASKTNNKIFKHFYNFEINDGFDARKKVDASIYLNYKLYKKGKVKLEGATTKLNRAHTYKLTFFGNTVALKDLIGEAKLADLPLISNFNFDYDSTTVLNMMSEATDITVDGEVYPESLLFPLITAKQRLIYDSSDNSDNTEELANIYYSGSNHGVDIGQLKPAIRLYPLIRAIELRYFADEGYTLTGDRDGKQNKAAASFFSLNNPVFGSLYMWLNNKTGAIFQDEAATINFTGYAQQDTTGLNPGRSVTLHKERIVIPALRHVKYDIVPSSTAEYSIFVYKNGELFKSYEDISGNQQLETQTDFTSGTYTFSVKCASLQNFTLNSRVSFTNKPITGTPSIRFKATASTAVTRKYESHKFIPEMKVMDFLTGLFKMFNLTAYITDDREIIVQTLDDYYSSSNNYYDITEFVDKQSSIVNNVLPYKQINFDYKDTKSFLAKNHAQVFKKEWGSLHFATGENFDGKVYKVEIPFAHFKYEKLRDIGTTLFTQIQWGWAVNEQQESYEHAPLLFYPILEENLSYSALNFNSTAVEKTSAFLPSNALFLRDNITTIDRSDNINFNAEINEFNGKPFKKSLFEVYYKTYIEDVFDKRRRLTKLKAYLPVSILQKLQLSDKIIVFNKIYTINKITTNFETLVSDIELINVTRSFEPTIPAKFRAVSETNITIDSTEVNSDNTLITTDAFDNFEGLKVLSTNEEVPLATAVPNDPVKTAPTTAAAPPRTTPTFLAVTPPFLKLSTPPDSTSTSVFLSINVSQLGKVGVTSKIDEYGFFYSSTRSDLNSTSITSLKANSSVTTVTFTTDATNKFESPGIVNYEVTGLTAPATIYFRAYGITNTDPRFGKGEGLTAQTFVKTASTPSVVDNGTVRNYKLVTEYAGKHTVRIMNDDGTTFDFPGVSGGIFSSRIVPEIIDGPSNSFELNDTFQPRFSGFGGQYITDSVGISFGRGTGYHATNRTTAEEYSKDPKNWTGASPTLYFYNRLSDTEPTYPFLREGYGVFTGVRQYSHQSNALSLAPDGFYAFFNFRTTGQHSAISGASARVSNGLVTDVRQYY